MRSRTLILTQILDQIERDNKERVVRRLQTLPGPYRFRQDQHFMGLVAPGTCACDYCVANGYDTGVLEVTEDTLEYLNEHSHVTGFIVGALNDRPDEDIEMLVAEVRRMQAAVRKHHQNRGHSRCWENDAELYREFGLESGDPERPPIEEHRQRCDEYRAQEYGVPVDGEPLAQLERMRRGT